MAKTTYHFDKVQRGAWGETIVSKKPIKVRARSPEEAHAVLRQRKDYGKRLRNGDRLLYVISSVK